MSQTVARAIEILEFVSIEPRTPTEVGKHLDVHRSTALRLLETLTESAITRRHPDGRYGVGYRLAGLAQLAIEQFDLTAVTRPFLARLAATTTHTVHMAVLEGDRIVYADKLEPPQSVRLFSQIGQAVTLTTAGVSKAILAYHSAEQVQRILTTAHFARYTATSITTKAAFLDQLEIVRQRGWAVDDGELEDYVNCIAMPVRDSSGQVIAAVSLTALKARATMADLELLLPALTDTTTSLSKELGWKA